MNNPRVTTPASLPRREFLQAGGALVVGFSLPAPAFAQRQPGADASIGKSLDTNAVDGFISINADGTVTIFSGKVDLGQGLRIAIPQMAAEELGIGVERIVMIEGDTALTPDQGPTAGSSGIMRRRPDPAGRRHGARDADRNGGGPRERASHRLRHH